MPIRENPSIELFNKARKHAFSVFNKYQSFEKAKFFLKDVRYSSLTPSSRKGLLAELLFYSKYKRELKLIPALDCGDKTDFTGEIEGRLSRIDVTTNLKYKQRSNYEEFIYDNWAFWLVNIDISSEDIAFIPLHFPLCEVCNKASIYNLVYLKQELDSTYIEHFTILKLCPYCLMYVEGPTYNWGIELFLSKPEVRQFELSLINDYKGIKELNKDPIMNRKGKNHWILEKGSTIVRLAKHEYNEPIAFVGEEPLAFDEVKKENEICPIIFWNNIWATSDISRILNAYIQFEG